MEAVELREETGRRIGELIGAKYIGIQAGFGDFESCYLFDDPVTGSCFAGRSVETARTGMYRCRDRFYTEKRIRDIARERTQRAAAAV